MINGNMNSSVLYSKYKSNCYSFHSKAILKLSFLKKLKLLLILSADNLISVWKYDEKLKLFNSQPISIIYGHFG